MQFLYSYSRVFCTETRLISRDCCKKNETTLEFQINVLDQISVLVGKNVKFNKRTGPNKCTGEKFENNLQLNQY